MIIVFCCLKGKKCNLKKITHKYVLLIISWGKKKYLLIILFCYYNMSSCDISFTVLWKQTL